MLTHPSITPAEYLEGAHRDWREFEEGDIDYLDGELVPHDYGDSDHSRMHVPLGCLLESPDLGIEPIVLPSFTLQITPRVSGFRT